MSTYDIGSKSLALSHFEWDAERSRMLYSGCNLKYGEPQNRIVNYNPADLGTPTGVTGAGGFGGEPPYEIWQYQTTGFVYLFIQDNRFDAWRMIYTTDPDKTSLADWANRVGPEALRDLQTNFGIRPR